MRAPAKGTLVWVTLEDDKNLFENGLLEEHGPIWVVDSHVDDTQITYICHALATGYEWAWYDKELTTEGEDNASAP